MLKGCVFTERVCPTENVDACTNVTCFDNSITKDGCTYIPKVCTSNATDCSTTECDPRAKKGTDVCVTIERVCAFPTSLSVVIGALSTAAIAGIVAALVLCAGLGSGATYAVYAKMDDGDLGAVSNNPLFKPSGNEQVNPLFKN
jgi:hypothetical protein